MRPASVFIGYGRCVILTKKLKDMQPDGILSQSYFRELA